MHRLRRLIVPLATSALLLGSTVAPTLAADTSVTIKGFQFQPATTTVHQGDTVTWTNQDSDGHNAAATDGSFQTAVIAQGKTASVTFNILGTFAYKCTIHPEMTGAIVVEAAAPATDAMSPSVPPTGVPMGPLLELLAGAIAAAAFVGHARRRVGSRSASR